MARAREPPGPVIWDHDESRRGDSKTLRNQHDFPSPPRYINSTLSSDLFYPLTYFLFGRHQAGTMSHPHNNQTSRGRLTHPPKISIRSVPNEILTEIFHAFVSLSMEEQEIKKQGIIHRGPIFLGSVCRVWRAVTLSCPRLWASVSGRIHTPAALLKAACLVRLINSRSGALPLHFAFKIHPDT